MEYGLQLQKEKTDYYILLDPDLWIDVDGFCEDVYSHCSHIDKIINFVKAIENNTKESREAFYEE